MNVTKIKCSKHLYLEPVNGAAVNERWELSESVSEGISYRTEGYYNV